MSDYGDDDPYHVDRGYKTDSYIRAVTGFPSGPTIQTDFVQITQAPANVHPVQSGREFLIQSEPHGHYGSLDYDEVDYYRKNDCWRTARWCCLCCFVLVWFLILFLTIYIILIHPRCDVPERDWWRTAVIYEVWTPSFRDSDADGRGDLNGVVQKLRKLRNLGVNTLYIRPFLKHDDADGMAILDFGDVQNELGTLKDVAHLVEQAHYYDFKVVIDFPLATTSKSHPWFVKSSQASDPTNQHYANFYFWKRNYETNDFISTFGDNGDVYYHVEHRPDLPVLNYQSHNVSTQLKSALELWVRKGIDGFHLRFADYLARTQDGMHPLWDGITKAVKEIRRHIQASAVELHQPHDKKIFLFASMDNIGEMEKLRLGEKAELDGVVNSELLKIAVGNRICERTPDSISDCSNEVTGDILQFFQASDSVWPLWQFGDSQTPRLASRTRSRLQAELLMMAQLLLPGTPILYYGDMVGSKDVAASDHPQRGAMAWDGSPGAGFSEASVLRWDVRLPSEWKQVNFENEYANSYSRLNVLKRLIRLRNLHPTFYDGRTYLSKPDRHSFSLCRFWKSENETKEAFVLSVNFGSRPVNHSIHDLPPFAYAAKHLNLNNNKHAVLQAQVLVVSSAASAHGQYSKFQKLNIAQGVLELGVDQGILYTFTVD